MQHSNATQHTLCPSLSYDYVWISRYLDCKKWLTYFQDSCQNDCTCRMVDFITLRHFIWPGKNFLVLFSFHKLKAVKMEGYTWLGNLNPITGIIATRRQLVASWTSCGVSHLVTSFSHNRPAFSFLPDT